VPIGAAFSQVGEFSFILGSVALGLGLINDAGWNALVAASIISIAVNPYIYRSARALVRSQNGKLTEPDSTPGTKIQPKRSILVGFGPVGKIVHQLLVDSGAEIIVVDLNIDTVRQLRSAGQNAIYGDVRQPGTMIEAGIETTETLILSADIEDAADIIKQALQLNPNLRVLARCAHLRDAEALRRAGAEFVTAGEAEVGVALTEAVISLADITAEHAPQRRDIRRQLYKSALS
jgi:CPA2 family monovalent cation:H+ antiporter-2